MSNPNIGPPFPGETLDFYNGASAYWSIIAPEQWAKYPPTLTVTAKDGSIVNINMLTGAIIK